MSKQIEKTVATEVNIKELNRLIEETCLSCVGIARIASKDDIKELKVKGIEQGISIVVRKNAITADVNLVMAYGVKISESLRECQKKIIYVVRKQYPAFLAVNLTAIKIAQ